MIEYIFLFFAVGIAFIIKGITGFGNTLVMGSLFSLAVPNKRTTPIDLIMSIPTNSYIAWKERKSISLRVVFPLSCLLIAGIIPGTFLLKSGNDWVLRAVFGIITIGMAIEILMRESAKNNRNNKNNRVLLIVIGVISGLLAGIYGIGALLVSYISRTADNRNKFRADICCVFLVENIFRFILYCITGIITKDIVLTTLYLFPAVVTGLFIGFKIDKKMKEKTVTRIVVVLLIVSGISLFVKSIIFK